MTTTLANWFVDNLGGLLNPVFIIFLVSMIPILELRGGLLVASLLHVDMWTAIPVCIIANLIPVPFILFLIRWIFKQMKKTKRFRGLVERLEARAYGKSETISNYEFLGLLLFVGIPLPGTGAWTGSLIAALLEVDKKKAIPAILLGLVLATCIMSFISYGLLGKVL